MISRATIYFFLCIFVQQHSCSPVPTNTKIRHDVRRSSVADDASTSSTTPSSSSTSSNTSTSVSSDSSSSSAELSKAGSDLATPLSVNGFDLAHVPTTTELIRLAEIFEEPVETNGKVKAKRDVPVKGVDEHESGDPLSFKPEHNENEDDLAVAETHLFRPLFKYKSVNSERRHIRQPTVSSTTTK